MAGRGRPVLMRVIIISAFIVGAIVPSQGFPQQSVQDAGEPADFLNSSEDVSGLYSRAELLRRSNKSSTDLGEAVRLYQILTDKGHGPSLRRLAIMYATGDGVAQNYETAIELYRRAIAAGQKDPLLYLARALRRTNRLEDSFETYLQAVDVEVKGAERELAVLSMRGVFETVSDSFDRSAGFELVTKLAEDGDPKAQLAVADAYRNGWGTEVDAKKSFALYRQLLPGGKSEVLNAIASMLRDGEGVERDVDQAIVYYQQAIDAGSGRAMLRLARVQLKADYYKDALASFDRAVAGDINGARLERAKAHLDGDFGASSNKTFGAAEITKLANMGDTAAIALALRKQERPSTRLLNLDLDRALVNATTAAEGGDARSISALLRYYRKIGRQLPGSLRLRQDILTMHGDHLSPKHRLVEELYLVYDVKGPVRARPVMAEMIQGAGPKEARSGMLTLRSLDSNAYTYALQTELREAGFFFGRPNGKMTTSTLRATMKFCQDIGAIEICRHGPLLRPATVEIIEGLMSRRQ